MKSVVMFSPRGMAKKLLKGLLNADDRTKGRE